MNAIDLASLLCSRLCHDLMSPVGALNNGIELLADEQDPEMREKCLELLAESARARANKLKFFRLAFGAAGGFGDEIDTREAEAALEGLYGAERRIELGWMVGRRQAAQGRGQAAAQPGDDRRRCAGARRPARRRRGTARRRARNGRSAPKGRGSCSIPSCARRSRTAAAAARSSRARRRLAGP